MSTAIHKEIKETLRSNKRQAEHDQKIGYMSNVKIVSFFLKKNWDDILWLLIGLGIGLLIGQRI